MNQSSAGFTPEMALATRLGAVAIAMLSMQQMADALRVVLERDPTFEEIMGAANYNQAALAAADQITANL